MQYLLFAVVPAPMTIDSESHKLRPGHLLIFEGGQVRQSSYWDLRYNEEHGERWSPLVLVLQRNAVITKNQQTLLPPLAVSQQSEKPCSL